MPRSILLILCLAGVLLPASEAAAGTKVCFACEGDVEQDCPACTEGSRSCPDPCLKESDRGWVQGNKRNGLDPNVQGNWRREAASSSPPCSIMFLTEARRHGEIMSGYR